VLVIGKHPGATDLALWVEGSKQPVRYAVTVGAASLGKPSEQSAQVQIDTRIVELSRRALRDAGINFSRVGNNSTISVSPPGLLSGVSGGGGTGFLLDSASGFLPLSQAFNLVYGNAGENLLVTVSVLEQNGLAHTLAEPTLVALSGQTASFLAGGELPIPVSQNSGGGGSSITIEFKPFGIRLMVTPDRARGRSHRAEGGARGLRARLQLGGRHGRCQRAGSAHAPRRHGDRARERRELRDQRARQPADEHQHRQDPRLGDLPVLGALFKTTHFEREDRELVMIVSPRLVKPLAADASYLPVPGEEYEHYSPGLYEMQLGEDRPLRSRRPGLLALGDEPEPMSKQRFIAVTRARPTCSGSRRASARSPKR
jgi:pilus assembly protein CpaC